MTNGYLNADLDTLLAEIERLNITNDALEQTVMDLHLQRTELQYVLGKAMDRFIPPPRGSYDS